MALLCKACDTMVIVALLDIDFASSSNIKQHNKTGNNYLNFAWCELSSRIVALC